MKTTVSEYDFTQAFMTSDTYKNNFSYSGLKALYEDLVRYEEDADTEIDFDMVAICCEYSEHESAVDAVEDYSHDTIVDELLRNKDEDEKEAQALEWLQERTQVIEFDGGVIIQQF